MENAKKPIHEAGAPSFGGALREIGTSVKGMVQSEGKLLKAEIKESARYLGKHSAQVALFGGLMAISTLPFLAFLVIGIGRLMNHNYWLSSLIIAIVCAVVGGLMAYRSYQKIRDQDLTLPRTRESIEESRARVTEKIDEVQDAVTVQDTTKRRVA